MYLGIFIIQLIIYILKTIKIEKFINNDDYEKGDYPVIKSAAIFTYKNTNDILVPDTSTLKIFKSSYL